MPITYPISLPSTPGTRRVKWDYEFVRGRARSPFTKKSQNYVWPGKLLRVGVEYPPMVRADAEAWLAALHALDEGSCLFGDPQGVTPRGLVANYTSNLLRWSEEFDRASKWLVANVTITPAATTDPLGGSTAQKVAATASAATELRQLVAGAGAVGGVAYSIYAKKGSGPTDANTFILRNQTTLTNLVTGTINYDTGAVTGGMIAVDVGGGWYRLSLVAASGMSAGDQMAVYGAFGAASETAGEYCYLWGAQLQQAVAASAYMPVGDLPVYSDIARDFLSFDGVDDYVSIPHNAAYNSNGLTVEFWFRAPSTAPASAKYLAAKWSGSGNDVEFHFQFTTAGKVQFAASKTDNTSTVGALSGSVFADGKWHHVAGVKAAGGALTLYVDGVQEGTAALGQEGDQTTNIVRLGNKLSGADAGAFPGPICEVRIWDTARTRIQLRENLAKQLVGNESGLVGYWRLDDKSGTVLDDLTATNNNGSVSGAAWSGLAATEILVANLAASRAGMFELGDWSQLGSSLTQRIYKMVGSYGGVAAAASSAAGVAHLEIRPNLREVPADQATLVVSNTKGVFELEEIVVGHEVDVAQTYGIAFNLVEAF